ncbi:DNA-binding MurR/RpiR family transcriptional regulator [Sedimentibacter acidaminivorans]|jgi:DNA-binding MurR/RpiR family transcriptional regulator|uniref:DNA-binding MurR/RpiR family transcriptional regulator n=1 Tax=Sedimentibacter acidaminivorans TaxID=913099 RepID=A0ABS4GCI6_9FIRM|nr:MurR/RpiR family transcriptional regulator [Sedimentibacter acidaminivorans]MBP1925398.1 DNA-binding MurR/RpiR family transcriptional regulator [Sedimentibacter acidaminivorans]
MKNNADLINLIKSNYYKFSKGQKQIAQFIIEHYDKAAFMTAAKIGETVDVSESTVVRFASSIGFSGFPELQKSLQVLIKNKLTTVQRIGLDEDASEDTDMLHKRIIRNEINSMRYLLENIDTDALDKATEAILNANKVYILGLRTSSTLANYLGFYLDVILDNVKVLNNSGVNSLYEEIIRVKETDVLIVISFPRYSNNTIEATKFVKEHKAKVIAITDTEASPFHSLSDVSLLAKSNIVSFIDSLVVPMCMLNSLIVNIGMQEKDDILQYYDRLEELWDSHSIYQSDNL